MLNEKIFLLIIVCSFYSCTKKDKDNTQITPGTDKLIFSERIDTTSSEVFHSLQKFDIPVGIALDTLQSFDSTKLLKIEIVLPKHIDIQQRYIDKVLLRIIDNEKNKFEKSVDQMIK
jgi:hypothetical protein